jgi:hypothetical protein
LLKSKSFPILASALLATCLFGIAAQATVFTGSASGTGGDGPISGTVSITTGAGTISVSLTSNTLAHSQGQALSDLSFDLSAAPGALSSFTQSGQLANVTPPTTVTDIAGNPNHWAVSNPSDNEVLLATAGPGAPGGQPSDMIIPGIAAGGVVGGFDNFNPYIIGTGTFTFNAAGVTANTTISDVVLSFGTSGSQENTLVVPAPLLGHGLLVLLAIGGVLFGGKFVEILKKHCLQAA